MRCFYKPRNGLTNWTFTLKTVLVFSRLIVPIYLISVPPMMFLPQCFWNYGRRLGLTNSFGQRRMMTGCIWKHSDLLLCGGQYPRVKFLATHPRQRLNGPLVWKSTLGRLDINKRFGILNV